MSQRDVITIGVLLIVSLVVAFPNAADTVSLWTAWRNNRFNVDAAGVVGRSDIVLRSPNVKPEEAMPLGNGRLGLAVWSEDGLTVQLNRADTLPARLSPGQIVLSGLKPLIDAKNYNGRLDLSSRRRKHGVVVRQS